MFAINGLGNSVVFFFSALAQSTQTASDHGHSVAFSAGLTHTQHVSLKDRIIYDKVFVNKGNGYDKNSGIFVCPVEGNLFSLL